MIKSRMYAALSATNEAILRTRAPEELFQRVCDAVVHGGGFKMAGTMLPDADGWLRIAAIAGYHNKQPISTIKISIKADSDRGQGLAGTAFRTGRPAVSNDYRNDFQNDERFRPFREDEERTEYGGAAAVPILKDGASVGVFLFYAEEAYSLNRETIALLERLAENVSFALASFEMDEERKRAERASRRASDMFAALSATNTAILRARNQDEMLQLVCDSVTKGGRSLGAAAIFMKQPDTPWLKFAAASGLDVASIAKMPLSVDPNDVYGQGLHGPAFREQKLFICYDVSADPGARPWVKPDAPPHGCSAAPLVKEGESVGVLLFFFGRTSGREDEGIKQLMMDIAANVSFGLDLFERADQQQRLSRMFSALSSTNEAIMRARTRDELYQMVCEAAVNGAHFTSTTILLAEADQDYFRLVWSAGPNVDIIKSRRYSPRIDFPEGRGLTGTAYRTGKPCVANDTRASERAVQWPYANIEERSSRAGAALPLFSQRGIVGVLLFMAAERGAFTDEFVELLQRLAENVSYALETFDRADEQKAAEKRIEYLATHDSLTGLPNRVMFNQLLEQSIKTARRRASKCAVLFIDLDRFKIINDSLGHAAGDTLLIDIAGRLKNCLRESDVVARLGGDEFVIILNDVQDQDVVEALGRKILASLLPSLSLGGHECRTTGSIGIAIYPDNGIDAHTLTRNADIAMYVAKEDGKNDLRFFSPEIKSQSIERLMLEANLRHAIELDQLTLHYQPKLDVASETISGVEALLRWNHPDLGNLSPMKFIPLAEETGLIIPIGRWVLRTACAQNMEWQRQGLPVITMAVNLSPRQFLDENLLRDLDDVLRETGMPPHLLQLEITESMVIQNVDRGIRVLNAIQSRGVRLAIDDFGTGYSSMSLMKQFPIDTIKIDRSFVRDLAENEEDRAIATAIINMGKALGLTIVAEGVETREQDAFLRRSACDELQGYLFSKPVPANEIPPLLTPLVASPPIQPRRKHRNRRSDRAATSAHDDRF
jgi:diguanylate cyclase (GGDEF)-like protein